MPSRVSIFPAVIACSMAVAVGNHTATMAAVPGPKPRIIGQLVDPIALNGVEDVHLEGDLLYLPCREGKRLTICSISDPTRPTVVSSFTHPDLGPVGGLAIHDDTVYLASQGNRRLFVLDVSNPSEPRLQGSTTLGAKGGALYKVAYRARHCYVAHLDEKKLFVVNVETPTRPSVVGSVAVTDAKDGPFSVLLRENYALVGTIFGNRNRLSVIDLRVPSEPRRIYELTAPNLGHASGEFVGDNLYAVNWNRNAFFTIDVSDASHPRLLGMLIDSRLGMPNRCAVEGDRAYLPMVAGHGVAVVGIETPQKPRFITAWSNPVLRKTYGAAVRGNLLLLGARDGSSLVIVDRFSLEPD